MKKSMYLVEYNSMDGKYYLMNTSSGNMISIDSEKTKELKQILNSPDECKNLEVIQRLKHMGFVVEDNINEFQIITGKRILRSFCKNNYLELIIMPTEKCNFRCVYCYENFAKPKMNNITIEAIIKYVSKNIKNHKGLVVSWFGGEPLLAIDVIEKLSKAFIDICKKNHKIYSSSMTTNGYLLTLDVFERLRRLRVNHYQITIDGDESNHDSQRVLANGKGSFKTIMNNLNDICTFGKGHLWTISLRTNVTNQIIQNIEKFKNDIIKPFNNDKRIYIMLRKMWTNNTAKADRLMCSDYEFEEFVNQCNIL